MCLPLSELFTSLHYFVTLLRYFVTVVKWRQSPLVAKGHVRKIMSGNRVSYRVDLKCKKWVEIKSVKERKRTSSEYICRPATKEISWKTKLVIHKISFFSILN